MAIFTPPPKMNLIIASRRLTGRSFRCRRACTKASKLSFNRIVTAKSIASSSPTCRCAGADTVGALVQGGDVWWLWAIMIAGVAVCIYLEQNFKWAAKTSGPVLALIGGMLL